MDWVLRTVTPADDEPTPLLVKAGDAEELDDDGRLRVNSLKPVFHHQVRRAAKQQPSSLKENVEHFPKPPIPPKGYAGGEQSAGGLDVDEAGGTTFHVRLLVGGSQDH